MLGPLTYLDAALVALAILSGLLAMYRGFTREVLSMLSWVAALGALLYFVLYHKPAAEDLAKQFSVPVPVAQVVMGAIIFLIVLMPDEFTFQFGKFYVLPVEFTRNAWIPVILKLGKFILYVYSIHAGVITDF